MHPQLHLAPLKNWCNDPIGFIYYQGYYHLFYQYFPYDCTWGTMHWKHVISKDFVHWDDLGIAIYPSKVYDANGCFSGSSLEVNHQMYIYYTSIQYTKPDPENIHQNISGEDFIASQSMVISPDGFHFDNLKNKKMIIPVFGENQIGHPTHTRDPKVWKHGETYYMVLGSRYLDENQHYQGQLLFYTSSQAKEWHYTNNYRGISIGDMWECPDIFAIGQQQFLIMSPERTENHGYPSHARITTCQFHHEHCDMEITGHLRLLDYGRDLYAPQTTTDEKGRRIYIGWMRMPVKASNWRGLYIFPRVIEYYNQHIYTKLHPRIKDMFTITTDHFDYQKATHIKVQLQQGDFINIGGYLISYQQCLRADRSHVFQSGAKDIDLICETPPIDQCHLDIYIDQYIIEIYINDGYYVLSHIVYHIENYIHCHVPYILKITE